MQQQANTSESSCEELKPVSFAVLELFHRFEHFIVLGHQKPDADCVTSQLAMSLALRKLGKNVQTVSAGPFLRPEIQSFAPLFQDRINSQCDEVLAIILDCNSRERTGFAKELKDLPVLVIDHHASGKMDGEWFYCDVQSPSTSMLVHNILLQLPLFLFQLAPQKYSFLGCTDSQYWLVNHQIANMLFLGFATDTGFFRFLKPVNAADLLRRVSMLVDKQINLQDVYQHMSGGKLQGTRRILGLLLLRAGFFLDGRLCVSYELGEDKEFWQLEANDSDSFYALALATQSCEAILLLNEAEPGVWNVGLRSLKQHDVGAIAARLGGGGHKNAAGCQICQPNLEQALRLLLSELCSLWQLSLDTRPEIIDYIAQAPQFLPNHFAFPPSSDVIEEGADSPL